MSVDAVPDEDSCSNVSFETVGGKIRAAITKGARCQVERRNVVLEKTRFGNTLRSRLLVTSLFPSLFFTEFRRACLQFVTRPFPEEIIFARGLRVPRRILSVFTCQSR